VASGARVVAWHPIIPTNRCSNSAMGRSPCSPVRTTKRLLLTGFRRDCRCNNSLPPLSTHRNTSNQSAEPVLVPHDRVGGQCFRDMKSGR
jgi:hypothetical protein